MSGDEIQSSATTAYMYFTPTCEQPLVTQARGHFQSSVPQSQKTMQHYNKASLESKGQRPTQHYFYIKFSYSSGSQSGR